MRRKYKLTGCARFLIFLIIVVPVIYISATLITGTSPWDELKMILSGDDEKTEIMESPVSSEDVKTEEVEKDTQEQKTTDIIPATNEKAELSDQEQLNKLLERIESLERELKELREQLDD